MIQSIGLVLSGGGARGLAQLGVLKALEQLKVFPNIISGTSAGALIGALYSAGLHPEEILAIAKEAKVFNFSEVQFGKAGVFSMKNIEGVILKHIPENNFDVLKIPLYVTTTDILSGAVKRFHEGILSKVLMASASVPLLFEPIRIGNDLLLDGGILDNLPIEPLRDKCTYLIGIHVNSIDTTIQQVNMKDMLDRSFHLALSQSIYHKAKQLDCFIDLPGMSRFGMFDMQKADELFQIGYEFTIANFAHLAKLNK